MLFESVLVALTVALIGNKIWNVWQTEEPQRFRFNSFAPVRSGSQAKWFVDGKDYMSAVADATESAKTEILITDWQMNPYIFMKRPDTGVDSLKWRLDKMLLRKADEGVRVYILLYWETQIAMHSEVIIHSRYWINTIISRYIAIHIIHQASQTPPQCSDGATMKSWLS